MAILWSINHKNGPFSPGSTISGKKSAIRIKKFGYYEKVRIFASLKLLLNGNLEDYGVGIDLKEKG